MRGIRTTIYKDETWTDDPFCWFYTVDAFVGGDTIQIDYGSVESLQRASECVAHVLTHREEYDNPTAPEENDVPSNQYHDAVDKAKKGETWVCPRCDHPTIDFPALSRRDNHVAVCSRCGVEEGVRQNQGLDPWPADQRWPFL